jgi:DNA-binding LacI/PurR family transcriptional regulator
MVTQRSAASGCAGARSDETRPRATIDDVARAAGVSRQTVSNVVRSRGRVGEETRARVLRTIEDVGYRPHAAASSLRSRRTRRLGHPMPTSELSHDNLLMVEFIQALVTAAGDRGHQLLLGRDDEDHANVRDLVRSGSVDGFVLANMAPRDDRVRLLADAGVPFACFGRTGPGLPQSWVDIDNRAAAREVTELLVHGGHRRISFLGVGNDTYWDRERESGYRSAMTAAGLVPHSVLTSLDGPATVAAIDALLDSSGRPSAVVSGSDSLAALVYSAAARRGLRIGVDLAVTGFDGGVVSRLLTPALTTVVIPVERIAARVLDRVLRELARPTSDPGEVVAVTVRRGGSA